jgi:ketosteroid isomerase-like protein
MKRKIGIAIAVLFVALGTPMSSTLIAQSPSTDEEIVSFIQTYDKAWNRKDVTAVERILADRYLYFTSTGAVSSRQRTLDMLRSPRYVLDSAERSEIEVYRTGNTAIVSSRWKGNGTYDNEKFRDDQRCGIVLARAGRSWKVLSEHCTQIEVR